ncbi:MAG: hypothetical protein WCP81_10840, partial [Actinomycetes bacterium]
MVLDAVDGVLLLEPVFDDELGVVAALLDGVFAEFDAEPEFDAELAFEVDELPVDVDDGIVGRLPDAAAP